VVTGREPAMLLVVLVNAAGPLLPLLLLPVEEDFQRSPLNGTEPGLLMMMTPWYIVGVKASTGSWFPRHHLPP